MKPYIVTLTYNFANVRDFNASIIVSAGNNGEAIDKAIKLLEKKVGNCFINHQIAFEFSI